MARRDRVVEICIERVRGGIDAARWANIEAAFSDLVQLDPTERTVRLAELRTTDPELGRWVAELLAGDVHANERLQRYELASVGAEHMSDPFRLNGRTISHFRLLSLLGTGGMGVVYRAEDLRLGRTVALKFLLPQYSVDAQAKARFLREAQAAGRLDQHQRPREAPAEPADPASPTRTRRTQGRPRPEG